MHFRISPAERTFQSEMKEITTNLELVITSKSLKREDMYGVTKRFFFRFPEETVISRCFDKFYLSEDRIIAHIFTTVTASQNAKNT